MNMSNVYVILVNYNGYSDTVECIESLLQNNYQNIKIIVIDNASTDNSFTLLCKKFNFNNKIEIIQSKENLGFAGGNNIGIKKALEEKADYILLLNNDTVVEKDFLMALMDFAKKQDGNCMYTGKILYYSNPEKIWFAGGRYSQLKGTTFHFGIGEIDRGQYDAIKEVDFICGCLLMMKSNNFKKLGMLSEEYFLYSEDLDYSLRAKNCGIKLIYIPQSRIYHKISASTSKIANTAQYYIIRNRFYIIQKYHSRINKIYAYIYSILWCCKHIKNREFDKKICIKALKDFKLKKMGKK